MDFRPSRVRGSTPSRRFFFAKLATRRLIINRGAFHPNRAATPYRTGSRAGDDEGLGRLAAEPLSPAPKFGDKKAEYRGGNGPNNRNPAGGAGGVWAWQCRGDRCEKREWTAGIGGRAVQLALTI